MLDDPNIEHEKSMFPYDESVLETVDGIRTMQQLIDNDFIDLQTEFDKPNDVVNKQIKQKKQKKIEETVGSILDEKNPFSAFDDFWWEDKMFSYRDSIPTAEASKDILKNIRPVDDRTIEQIIDDQFIPIDDRIQQELEDNNYASFESETDDVVTLEGIDEKDNKPDDNRPIDNRTIQEIIDDQFIPIDERTQQELQDQDNISLESESEIENIDLTSAWDNKQH